MEIYFTPNPSDNKASSERTADDIDRGYTLGLDLIDGQGRRSRFWFRCDQSRAEFARLFTHLHETYGHSQRAEVQS